MLVVELPGVYEAFRRHSVGNLLVTKVDGDRASKEVVEELFGKVSDVGADVLERESEAVLA